MLRNVAFSNGKKATLSSLYFVVSSCKYYYIFIQKPVYIYSSPYNVTFLAKSIYTLPVDPSTCRKSRYTELMLRSRASALKPIQFPQKRNNVTLLTYQGLTGP